MDPRTKPLKNDVELLKLINEEMEFLSDEDLFYDKQAQLDLIRYFYECYENTDQDTVLFAPEFLVVVRSILNGYRPVKLYFLTDFEGEVAKTTPKKE